MKLSCLEFQTWTPKPLPCIEELKIETRNEGRFENLSGSIDVTAFESKSAKIWGGGKQSQPEIR